MENFLTWEILNDYASFVGIVFSMVAVTKELPLIKKIPTRVWSFILSFILLALVHLKSGTYTHWDIVIYLTNAIMISLTTNGLADVNKGGKK